MMGAFGASVLFTTALWIAALPWPTLRPRQTNGRPGMLESLVLLTLTGGYVFILGPGISFGAEASDVHTGRRLCHGAGGC